MDKLSDKSKSELLEMAAEASLNVSDKMTRAELIKAIYCAGDYHDS
ncbi:MAG: hypothetical protein RR263_05005 [Oscillospiraceae bacterium]